MNNGFTLLEVMLAMSLFITMALLSSPFYGRFVYSQEVPVVLDELRGSFSKAQMYSMTGKGASSWGVVVNNNQILMFQGDTFATRDADVDEVFSIHPNVSISGLDTEVVFSRTTGTPTYQPAIVVSGNGATETLQMNAEGVLQ